LTKPEPQLSAQDIPRGQRIALTVEYNGAAYNGWQLQQGSTTATTVQGALEAALGEIAAVPVRLYCAGRTDTGVHATNQVAHFDAPASRSCKAWLMGGNARLPDSVVIKGVQVVAADFHARFSARSRRYRYLILNTPVRSALAPEQLTWVRYPLDIVAMHTQAQDLLGERDFSSFRAASCQSRTAMRHVDFIRVYRRADIVVVDIQANAFLHHMVRNIVGTLLAAGRGQLAAGEVANLLALRDRTRAPETAPANGLYLVGVSYPAQFALPCRAPGPVFLQPDEE
jgi:tRNA pseudouridine38-40 synthase